MSQDTLKAAAALTQSVIDFSDISGVELQWNGSQANLIYNSRVIAIIFFHGSAAIVEPLDLTSGKGSWRRFEYANPRFPETAVQFMKELIETGGNPPYDFEDNPPVFL